MGSTFKVASISPQLEPTFEVDPNQDIQIMMVKTFHIGLIPDFRLAPPAMDGISEYSHSLITTLNTIPSPFYYTIFINEQHRSLLPDLTRNFRVAAVRSFIKSQIIDVAWYFFVLPHLARRYRIDLLHLFAGNRRLSLFPFAKTIVTVHDMYHYYTRGLYSLPRFLFCKYVLSDLLKRHPHILAVSAATKSDLENTLYIPSNRIRVVPNGYNQRKYRVLSKHEICNTVREKYSLKNEFLLYVSALDHPRKNHLTLIQAYHYLQQTMAFPFDLVFVGEEFWESQNIYTEIETNGLKNHIKILGYVPDDDLVMLYNMAKIFVHPSNHEGFGLPILEAMGCGLPVACSDIPIFREVARDAALFFNQYDPKDIAEKIRLLWKNKSLYDECRLKGLKRAKQFSWQNTAEKVIELYKKILLRWDT
jgi:glycosyltransferase involved in cell wall biosynthesis